MQNKLISTTQITHISSVKKGSKLELPLYSSPVSAGFPSPADDFLEGAIDLNQQLITNPASTFLVRVQGESMTGAGIFAGDVLIVDKSKDPKSGEVVIAVLDGDFLLKRFVIKRVNGEKQIWLEPENSDYNPLMITQDQDFQIWGVIKYVIHNPN